LTRQALNEIRTLIASALQLFHTAAQVLKLASTPFSPLADFLADDVQVYLDYLTEQQMPECTWEPAWSWGDRYPDTWKQAHWYPDPGYAHPTADVGSLGTLIWGEK